MADTLSQIDAKILSLKKKRENLQTQQALAFFKEAQKILGDEFSPEMAIQVLSRAWKPSLENETLEKLENQNLLSQEESPTKDSPQFTPKEAEHPKPFRPSSKAPFQKSPQEARGKKQKTASKNTQTPKSQKPQNEHP